MKRFIGSGRLLLTVLSFLAGTSLAFAQGQVTVSGTILDENNAPMIGVGIVEQGTLNGVISDIDGNYSIEVPEGATLEFSCVGYITQQHRAVEGEEFSDWFRFFREVGRPGGQDNHEG